jgi:hypothetical protein
VAGGSGGWFSHQGDGNLKRLVTRIREAVVEKTASVPFLLLDQTWTQLDTTLGPGEVDGVNNWFAPPEACSVREWHGRKFGMSVPGFADPESNGLNRVIPRNGGDTLRSCLSWFASEGVFLTVLEGLTDVEESAGFYRSVEQRNGQQDWSYPEQYLDIVRFSMPPR